MFHVKHADVPTAPPAARLVFAERIDLARRYAELLATDAVERGLIGPREIDRIWDRHLLNSAAVAELIADGARVADVGSGAGLPGIPVALARPDLQLTLIDPMLRRTTFLHEVIDSLDLGVEVVRGRAQDLAVRERVNELDAVLCRAVATLDKLTRWCMPLLRQGGHLLAIKGDRADEEVAQHRRVMAALGAGPVRVMRCGGDYLESSTTVVVAERTSDTPRPPSRARTQSGRRS
jgi:16S rRNA (guanine527-N7)-methyltransferase